MEIDYSALPVGKSYGWHKGVVKCVPLGQASLYRPGYGIITQDHVGNQVYSGTLTTYARAVEEAQRLARHAHYEEVLPKDPFKT